MPSFTTDASTSTTYDAPDTRNAAAEKKPLKFLIHSNGPNITTGYGVQTRHLADRLAAQGYDVAVSCTYGHQGPVSTWRSPSGHDVRLYPSGYETNSPDVIIGHAEHFFEGDPSSGWIILLIDTWCFERPLLMQTLREDFQVVSWCPVDHFPTPPGVLRFLQGSGAVPVAMSRYGAHQLTQAGMDPSYVPLSVDTSVYKPTPMVQVGETFVNARELFELPLGAFVVGMVAMNKGWSKDRKGFGEAFQAFARFWRDHQHAVLFVHTEKHGAAEGINLPELAAYCGIPAHAIVYSQQYAYRIGLPADMMAAAYTAMDVLLAPSRGEGFCVPLIEAQACGVPVIASEFTAQTELVGAGWTVGGQLDWDPAQHAFFQTAFVDDIVDALKAAHGADLVGMQALAREFAANYDVDKVYDTYWRPFLATLEPPALADDKPPMERVAVVVPAMRVEHVAPLVESWVEAYDEDEFSDLYFVCGPDDTELIATIEKQGCVPLISDRGTTFAQKANYAYANTDEDWILLIGEDCRFTPGWAAKPFALSSRYDVIGTNDAPEGEVKNPDVAAGRHADHWFTRRSYIDEQGACLEGPGVFCPEAYYHWWTDKEVVELAKARGVFAPCLESHIVHLHPGYDGDEEARAADPVYMKAVENADADERAWRLRAPLIEGHRVTRAR